MALQISDPSCESWYLNTVTSSRLHSSFATEPCGRHCQLVLFPWQSISLRYNFWTDFCFWAMIAGTLLGMYSEFLSHGSLRNVGLPFSEVCIQYAFLPPKRNLIVDLCGSATIDMAAPSTHAAMITKNLSMLTASALSSAQYPAISCSSWPAIPSNDREWNSVRTSSGRCSRYSSIARCSALSATSPLSAPLQGHISVICSDVPKQLLYHPMSECNFEVHQENALLQ